MKRKSNYNEVLIISAALVTIVRYSAAFVASDVGQITGVLSEVVTVGLALSGIGMGVLDVIGGMVLFQGWRSCMPRAGQGWPFRFKALTLFVYGLLVNGMIIIVPFTVSRVTHSNMDAVLGTGFLLWFWAIAVNIAPYMVVGGVSISAVVVNADANGETNGGRISGRNRANGRTGRTRTYESLSPTEKYYVYNTETAA